MKRYFACLFLGLAAFSHAMEEEESEKKVAAEQSAKKILLTYSVGSSSSSASDTGSGALDIHEFECKPTEERKRMHQLALANAPERIKDILESERYPDALRKNWLLLYGPSGTGKSTLAEAMACYWGRCFIVPAGRIMGDCRGRSLERLNYLFSRITQEPGKKTLVIDEINKLTDNYTSEHTDANETGMALWTNLDQFRSYLNFFLIGTANETKKLPPQLQTRFKGRSVEITGRNNDKRQMIEHYLTILCLSKDPSIDEQFITQLAEKTQDFSFLDIETLIGLAKDFALSEPSKTLTPACIEKALEELAYESEHAWDLSEPISDEERYRQESLKQQKEFHDQQVVNNAAAEAGLAWDEETHSYRHYHKDGGDHRSDYDDHRHEVLRYLTPEQKELLEGEKDRQTEERRIERERLEREQRENPSRLRRLLSSWSNAAYVELPTISDSADKKDKEEE